MSPANQNRRFKSVSIFWLLPNVLTVAGLVSGLTALRFALDGRWSGVIGLIVLAAVFDALDGRTARRFKTSSSFGAALDSLSDLVVFGVVPALCLYLWALQDSGRIAWWATLFYAVAIALRLARFDSGTARPAGPFQGLFLPACRHRPRPSCCWCRSALIWNLASVGRVNRNMSASGLLPSGRLQYRRCPHLPASVKLPVGTVLPVLAGGSLLIAGAFVQPWLTYVVLAGVYVVSLPLSVLRFYRTRPAPGADTD